MGFKDFTKNNVSAVTHPERLSENDRSKARTTLFWGGSLLLAVVLALIIVSFLLTPKDPQTAAPGPVPTAGPPSDPASQGPQKPGCPLENTAKDIAQAPPTADAWVLSGYGLVPQVKGAGPCRELPTGREVGYAHTMTGAVVAAHSYARNFDVDNPTPSTEEDIKYLVVPGALRDGLIEKAKKIQSGAVARGDTSSSYTIVLKGYKVLAYKEDAAQIQLFYGSTAPGLAGEQISMTVKLVWASDDWRIDPASPDQWLAGTRDHGSMSGVAWTPDGKVK